MATRGSYVHNLELLAIYCVCWVCMDHAAVEQGWTTDGRIIALLKATNGNNGNNGKSKHTRVNQFKTLTLIADGSLPA